MYAVNQLENHPFVSGGNIYTSLSDRPIEQELLSSTSRTVRYSPRITIYRRWWWNIIFFCVLLWIYGVHSSLGGNSDDNLIYTMMSFGLLLLIPLMLYAVTEYYWKQELQLLETGIATTAVAKSGQVDDSDGKNKGVVYNIKYYAEIGQGANKRLESDTICVSESLYRSLTKENPYFTILYNETNHRHRAIYSEIQSGLIVK